MATTLALPFIAPNLIDRDNELAHILAALTSDTPLLTIVGPGGAGKTHLSVRAARQLQSEFERVVFVDLSAAKTEMVLPMVLQQLELPSSDNVVAQLAYIFSQHKTLLILDNFETVLEAAPRINELLGHCPSLRILVTSRSHLGLRAESCLPLPPLVTNPKDAPAVDFFVKRVQTLQPQFRLQGQEEDIYKLCQRLDGLPLALELAAACVPAMTPAALLEHLVSHPSLPEVTVRDLPLRQQNLYRLVTSSVSLLGVREQTFFCRLGVFAGSFSLEAARPVTDAESLGLDVTATLIKLCEHSLIVAEPVVPPRYKLLETIRAVALEMLSDPDPFADAQSETPLVQAQRRHLEYYLGFSRENYKLAQIQGQELALALLMLEQLNIAVAVRWSAQQSDVLKELGLRLLLNTAQMWDSKSQIREVLDLFDLYSLDHTHLINHSYPASLQIQWYTGRVGYLTEVGYTSEAVKCGLVALELVVSQGSSEDAARMNIQLGNAYLRQSDFAKALEYFDSSAQLARHLGHRDLLMKTINNRGNVYKQLGDTLKARACYEEALQIARELDDRRMQVMVSGNYAVTWIHEDKYHTIVLLEEALAFARKAAYENDAAYILQNLSELYFRTDQFEKAKICAGESLSVRKIYGDIYNIAWMFSTLGFYTDNQDGDLAKQYFQESQRLFVQLGLPVNAAYVKSLAARRLNDNSSKASAIHLETMRIILSASLVEAEYMTACLDALLELEVKVGRLQEAAVLWGAIQKLGVFDKEAMLASEALVQLTANMDEAVFEESVERGKTINLNDLYKELRQRWTPAKTGEQKMPAQTHIQMDALSLRQLEVLKLVAQGYSSKKIAKTFGLSEPTVKYHLNAIFNKLGVNSRAEAVAQATQRHLL
jgi:predicted ATPase/DNA-binding CsgD family transcriptional regulator